jgi:hypothetical protein
VKKQEILTWLLGVNDSDDSIRLSAECLTADSAEGDLPLDEDRKPAPAAATPGRDCPELDKLKRAAPLSQVQGTFIDWLKEEKEIILARWTSEEHGMWVPACDRMEALLQRIA